jgi:Zn-dependent M28 family amino/carboxypeptidase
MGIKVMHMYKILVALLAFIILGCTSPSKDNNKQKQTVEVKRAEVPEFNADSAFVFVQKQVRFGPRVPNTEAHVKCAAFLKRKLKSFGADVIVQEAELRAFDNTLLHAKNIIGQYNPLLKNRILLFAHWDSRPFADYCEDPARRNEPVLGANDGASGVGVLLEIARHLKKVELPVGVDIIFFDAEDYGTPAHLQVEDKGHSWCLGSQYWAKNPHTENYYAQYGILLDMVGAPNATFHQELFSLQFAPHIVHKVWNKAASLGYGSYFVYDRGGYITDDHVYVNQIRNIPCIDIIQYDPSTKSSFGSYWHTHKDNMDLIDKYTLKAVGQTILDVVVNER